MRGLTDQHSTWGRSLVESPTGGRRHLHRGLRARCSLYAVLRGERPGFHPDIPIRLLVGGPLQRGLEEELRRYWNVGTADLPRVDYGWGFVKLEPLFRPAGERFLVLDSDTAMTGPVLDRAAERDADFIVDDEVLPDQTARGIYYDWDRSGDHGGPSAAPSFLFNTGQWFDRSGLLSRDHFQGLVHRSWPPRLVKPDMRVAEAGYRRCFESGYSCYEQLRTALRELS